jgi:hypothetical protein
MAGGRRIPIRGSIPSLSPTEGKFRVKGAGHVLGYFWTGTRLNAMKAGVCGAVKIPSSGVKIFSLGRTVAITDNASS